MFYLDSQRSTTRRDSSLIVPKRSWHIEEDVLSTARESATRLPNSDSFASLAQTRQKGSVRKEVITLLFDSMLGHIIKSWDTIFKAKIDEDAVTYNVSKSTSDSAMKPRKKLGPRLSKTRRSRSKIEIGEPEVTQIHTTWWSSPDERAVIHFRNGNLYEGAISMRVMHGNGRFQWADGTVYMGDFKENEICGLGRIQWKDDSWYEGGFRGALRHGNGLYVDSRRQCCYSGDWHCATKHGTGVMHYSENFKNFYDGDWVYNVRHGYGCREYCQNSVYEGEWDNYIRDGKGVMIWPNHDFYKGFWTNGVMSGDGLYIWDIKYNNTMSPQSLIAYKGQWEKGQRHGKGFLDLGLGLGSFYKGEFLNNKKHGSGKFISNNGLLLRHKKMFINDNLGSLTEYQSDGRTSHIPKMDEPFQFDISDTSIGLYYHIEQALKNIDKEAEDRAVIVHDFMYNNNLHSIHGVKSEIKETHYFTHLKEFVDFEESSLQKALRCYENSLRNIYYRYSVICNKEEVNFKPILIRLYLWQMFFDCNLHAKGMTFVQIDNLYYDNPDWSCRSRHDPFEKIYYWQFLHILISVARILYAQRTLPYVKPETILASAFRTFMDTDVLPKVGGCIGKLVNLYGSFVPLRALYSLYRSLGEPVTVLQFVRAVRAPPHEPSPPPPETPSPTPSEETNNLLPLLGNNAYIYGDEMTYISDVQQEFESKGALRNEQKLFVLDNLSTRTILKVFANIFPNIFADGKLVNLDVQMTFFEFIEVLLSCTEESIKLDEEMAWREKFPPGDTTTA